MPTFYTYAEVSVDPDEFLGKCSSLELRNIYESLKSDYDMETECNENVRSESHRIFLRDLTFLRENWYSVSVEDAQIIDILAKKYGVV